MTQKDDSSHERERDIEDTQAADMTSLSPEAHRAADAGNIDKIRDILFGGQMQDYDRRFSRFEAELQRVEAELHTLLSQRCDGLERQLQQEVASLQAQLAVEQGARVEAVTLLTQDVKALGLSFEAKTAQLAEQASRANQELKQRLLEESRQLSLEIQQKYTDISALLEKELADLRHAKLDRTALADLFGEAVERLQK